MFLAVVVLALLGVAVASLIGPNVRAAAAVHLGVAWILLCWFWLARTKTLTLGGYTLLYAVCVPWSICVGLISLQLLDLMPADWPLRGAGTLGPGVGIAAVTEEAFKLVPVAVLVLLAPGRARRFAAVDWLLVGLAAGAGFLTAEEVQRRLALLRPGSRGLLNFCAGGSIGDRIDCYGLAQFGLNPFGVKHLLVGLFAAAEDGAQYGGHHVLTALVCTGVGLGVVWWRSASRRSPSRSRTVHRVAAVALPLALLWMAVADHVILNVTAQTGGGLAGVSTRWLGEGSTIPWPFQLWWYIGGHGHHRTGLLLALLVVAMLCDAHRVRRHDHAAITTTTGPGWADRAIGWVQARLGGLPASGPVGQLRTSAVLVAGAGAGASLAHVVLRDVRLTLSAHAKQPEESRRDAMLRGRAVPMMQREAREIAADVDAGPGGRHRYRLVALGVLAALLMLGLVAGPALARTIGYDVISSGRWLAGLAEQLGRWWSGLSFAEQVTLTVLAALVLAIPFGFGWGLFLGGGLTYLAAHGQGTAALLRNPRQATRTYLAERSVGGMALDAGEFALTFIPAGAGARIGVLGRAAYLEDAAAYAADPAAWRAAQRQAWKSERGEASIDAATGMWLVNGRRTINHRYAGELFPLEKRFPELAKKYPQGVRFTDEGFPDFSPHAVAEVDLKEFAKGNDRGADFTRANKEKGYRTTPTGYVWHHHEDGRRVLLVPEDLHDVIKHTGGWAVSR